jgi:hypothetical protein
MKIIKLLYEFIDDTAPATNSPRVEPDPCLKCR